MSLKRRILLMTIAIFLLGGLIFGLMLYQQQSKYEEEIMTRYAFILELSIRGIQDRINNALLIQQYDDIRRIVRSLYTARFVSGIKGRDVLDFIYVVDKTGLILASSYPKDQGKNISEVLPSHFFYQLRRTTQPVFIREVNSTNPRIILLYPMFMFGYEDFMGGIIASLPLSSYVIFKNRVRFYSFIFGAVILIGIVLSQWTVMHHFIFKPLGKMSSVIHKLMETRDLNLRVDINQQDEIGYLAQSFNVLLDFIKNNIENLRKTIEHLDEVRTELQQYSQQLLEGAQQQIENIATTDEVYDKVEHTRAVIEESTSSLIAFAEETSSYLRQAEAAIDQVTERTDLLSKSLERNASVIQDLTNVAGEVSQTGDELSSSVAEAVAAVTELNFSIREVESSSEEAAAQAHNMVENTEKGQQAVESTVFGMEQIQEAFRRVVDAMDQLIKLTDSIDRISESIQNIASHTHLLSINASILAAQAGEHGRAFSVIVQQIQSMAGQTSKYTRDINQLLQKIRQSSVLVHEAIEESSEAIRSGLSLAERAQSSLIAIRNSTLKVDEYVNKIANATREQARGSGQIQEAINRVNDIAGALNDVLKQLEHATNNLQRSTQEVRSFVENLKLTMNAQARSSRQMFSTVARIPKMLESMESVVANQKLSMQKLSEAMDGIRIIGEMNTQMVQQLRDMVTKLNVQSEELMKQIGMFQI